MVVVPVQFFFLDDHDKVMDIIHYVEETDYFEEDHTSQSVYHHLADYYGETNSVNTNSACILIKNLLKVISKIM